MRVSGPYAVGVRKIVAFRSKLEIERPGETKAERAYRQLEAMIAFRRDWNRKTCGELDHALALLAFDESVMFDPRQGGRRLFCRLVLKPDRRRAHVWGEALQAVETAGFTLADIRQYGMQTVASAESGPGAKAKLVRSLATATKPPIRSAK